MSALADCFHDSVDQEPWKTTVLLRGLGVIAVLAVVLAVAIQELVGEQLLNAIEQKLHEAWNFGFHRQFEDVEILISVELIALVGYLHNLLVRNVAEVNKFLKLFYWQGLFYFRERLVHQFFVSVEGSFMKRLHHTLRI